MHFKKNLKRGSRARSMPVTNCVLMIVLSDESMPYISDHHFFLLLFTAGSFVVFWI